MANRVTQTLDPTPDFVCSHWINKLFIAGEVSGASRRHSRRGFALGYRHRPEWCWTRSRPDQETHLSPEHRVQDSGGRDWHSEEHHSVHTTNVLHRGQRQKVTTTLGHQVQSKTGDS